MAQLSAESEQILQFWRVTEAERLAATAGSQRCLLSEHRLQPSGLAGTSGSDLGDIKVL